MAERLPPILLVGCGKMGGALLSGWVDRGLDRAVVVTPRPAALGKVAAGISVFSDASEIPETFVPSVVVFATKPQYAAEVLPLYARYADCGAIFLSIMAGLTVAGLQAKVGGKAHVVRAMPNTPAAIRNGFTCMFAGDGVSAAERDLCGSLLEAVGEVAWLERESLLDPATAISGGGPAYVFLLAELLEAAALDQGFPATVASRMARATISGAGALLAASELSPAQLRIDVTSPGGTTEQALRLLMAPDAWPHLVSTAIDAASMRSRELSDD
ncbi:pyrroline-5-carboxylate reductase (plasmid) [Agrobacterium leguminum]|uniref:Pyrroline-5-carboxylate reductase n=1 Tax=Agrobacterium deltaense NCPPB 1641 TaxID=1183425 RepID=A0A1S7U944_9HYPH|nr:MULTISPECIES: pyrroline-5-carboxylate reductase [Agrobacterium]WFS70080.1 pyrroline-5-carboxylate reductase [Agrobacterium leguminum]CVI63454.1 Pyrroline-5-carboxylate reductase [Agrobacterium deltaense NCPPB 1641]